MPRAAFWYSAGQDPQVDEPLVLDDGTPGPMFVRPGVKGIEAPSWTVSLSVTPGVTGASFQQAVADTRSITVPIYLSAPTRDEMLAVKNMLIEAINPEGGPGILELWGGVGTPNGTQRLISAVYAGGLEGNEAAMSTGAGRTWWEFETQFTGLDHWYSRDLLHATWAGKQSTPFFHPGSFFPFQLSAYGVDAVADLEIRGNGGTYPTWELTGPFTRARVTNLRSQRVQAKDRMPDSSWEISRVTAASELVRVVTKPNEVEIRLFNVAADGSFTDAGNVYSSKSAASVFDPLITGDSVDVVVDGTTSATFVELWAKEYWLTHG